MLGIANDNLESCVCLGGRYEIRRMLGRGGMGVVYEAFDRVRASRVALKTMRNLGAAELYRFKKEFRALADVSHRNLVSLLDLEADGEQIFFTMEHIEGVDFLAHVTRQVRSLPLQRVPHATDGDDAHREAETLDMPAGGTRRRTPCDIGRLRPALAQLVEGVAALHACGKIHRDLKPSNVLVTREGRVVILDFGLVAPLGREGAQTGEHGVLGTPEYMSPEQAASGELTYACDWYAVGVMLYEALSGELPFAGPPLSILVTKQEGDPRRPIELAEGVPEDLDELCVALLQRNPSRRPDVEAIRARLAGRALAASQTIPQSRRPLSLTPLGLAFVGRERHLAELSASFEIARSGRTAITYVHGSSGMGKTLLIERFLATLTEHERPVVLAGRCYERESVPYKALDSVVDALSAHLARLDPAEVATILPVGIHALARVFPTLGRVEAVRQAPRRARELSDPHELRRSASLAFRELVWRMAMWRPLVVWIDDLQWGDSDSAGLIHELVRPPDPPPFLLIVSYRSEEAAAPLVQALKQAHARDEEREVREIEVGPLERDAALELALALLPSEDQAARAKAAIAADESGGSPLFVEHLVRHLTAGEALTFSSTGPTLRLDDVLSARVAELPIDATRLLEVVAVAGGPISRSAAAAAAGVDGEAEVTALAVLRAGRFLRSLRTTELYDLDTYHDRIRETVVAQLRDEDRRGLHLRIARALLAGGRSDPETLVAHLREAGDIAHAAELASVAAERAVRALAFDRAAALWRVALERPALTPDEARALRWKLGDVLANAGRGKEAAAAYLAAVEGASAADRLELRRCVAAQLLRSGHLEEGTRALHEVLAEVGTAMPAPWLVLILLVVYELALRVRGIAFRERDRSELPARELTRIDIYWAASATLVAQRPLVSKIFQKKYLLLALRAGEPTRIARGLAMEAGTSAVGGVATHGRTTRLLQAAQALAERVDDPYSSASVVFAEGSTALFEGRFRHAREMCDRAAEDYRSCPSDTTFEMQGASLLSMMALFHLGEMAELARRMPLLVHSARQRGDVYLQCAARIGVMNAVWLAADDPERAKRELDEAMAQWGSADEQVQQYHELVARVQLDLYTGERGFTPESVRTWWTSFRRAQLFRVQLLRILLWHLRGRVALGAFDKSARDPSALARAALGDARRILRENQKWSNPLGRLLEGAAFARRGDKERALACVASATEGFEASDMALWAAAARWRHGELIGGERGRKLIDEAEARFRDQAVKEPAKYCAMLAPGYRPPPSKR